MLINKLINILVNMPINMLMNMFIAMYINMLIDMLINMLMNMFINMPINMSINIGGRWSNKCAIVPSGSWIVGHSVFVHLHFSQQLERRRRLRQQGERSVRPQHTIGTPYSSVCSQVGVWTLPIATRLLLVRVWALIAITAGPLTAKIHRGFLWM